MPTYEYVCSSCRRRTEAVQRFSDPPLTECPHCGGALKRVFHPVGIVLKGSGFYSTDNRAGRAKPAAEPTKPAETTTETRPDKTGPAESKPAATKKTDAPKKAKTKK